MVARSLLPCRSQTVCLLSPKPPVFWRCSHFDRRTACLAIGRVVAWRLFHLARLKRENPDVLCSVFFEAAGRKAIVSSSPLLGATDAMPPILREAGRSVGQMRWIFRTERKRETGIGNPVEVVSFFSPEVWKIYGVG